MILIVVTPNKRIVKKDIQEVIAEGGEGSFGLLPNHQDYLSAIIPSILTYRQEGKEGYIAVDDGILVKKGEKVSLCTKEAFEKENLGQLKKEMEESLLSAKESEKRSRQEMLQMEISFIKKFYSLKNPE